MNTLFKADDLKWHVVCQILKSTTKYSRILNRNLKFFFVGFFFFTWIKIEFSPLFTALKKCISSNHKDFLCLEGYPGDLLELKKCLDFLPITKSLIINLASFLVCSLQQSYSNGTIQVLRQHVFGFFRPTHPPTSA